MNSVAKTIGGRIREIRESLSLSQKDFANFFNSSLPAIQSYELGKSVPGGKVLEEFSNQGFDVNWILTGAGNMKKKLASEEFPLLSNLNLLEKIIKKVDKHFSTIGFSLPPKMREDLIVKIYRTIQQEGGDVETIIGDKFSAILQEY